MNSCKSMVDVSCFALNILYKVINNLEISFMHYELVETCLHTDNYRPISLFKMKINNGEKIKEHQSQSIYGLVTLSVRRYLIVQQAQEVKRVGLRGEMYERRKHSKVNS